MGVGTGTGWASPSLEEWCGAGAGPPAPTSGSNLPSRVLTPGPYGTFQMDVQKPALSGTQPSEEGSGKLTRRGQAKPKGNT